VQRKAITEKALTGGTFTISNLGMYGVDSFNAAVSPAQTGILSVLQIPNFFSRREDFSSSQQCLRVLRGQKSINTEVTEMLRVLCVKA
jgi:hypothetical protein